MFKDGYALLIGIDENKLPNLALPIVKSDVTKLHEVITHPDRCGYPAENVRVLTGPDATRANILDGLDWLLERLSRDPSASQTALIYFSGHGHAEPAGEAFLLPYDTRKPERSSALRADDFADAIAALNPRRLLVILDCCHAAAMNVKSLPEPGLKSTAVTVASTGIARLAQGEGRAVLSSSKQDQPSFVRTDGQMSIFTYHLIEALTGHTSSPGQPDVLVTDVMSYVARKVPESTRSQYNADQQPVPHLQGDFPIALVLGGKGIEADVPAPDPLAPLPPLVVSTMRVREVDGDAVNVEVTSMQRGEIRATTEADKVGKGASLKSVKIDQLG